MKSKKVIIPIIALGILSLMSILGVRSVRANKNNTYPPIVQKLAERFNLNTEEVQQVFDEDREGQRQQMQIRFEEHLDQAINDGKITEEQKQVILAKREEMKTDPENFRNLLSKDLSSEERREKMEAHREEVKVWAEESGIDLDFLPTLLRGNRHGGFDKPHFGR